MINDRITRIYEAGIICINQRADLTCLGLVYNEDLSDIKALHCILQGDRGIKTVPLMSLTTSPNLVDRNSK